MSQPRQQRQQGEQPFQSNIPAIPQEEQNYLGDDGLDLNLDLENPDTSGYTTSPDETQSTVSSFQSQGSLHLSDLQGGAKKKTAKKKTAKKKTAKKKTAKKKTAKKKTAKKKTAKKKTAKKKTAKKKTAKKKTAKKKTATKKKTAKKKTAKKKTEEKKSTGFFGLFKGGKDKEKKPQQFIAPMERLL
jgi:flagellar biosynthesis GTPase FlhF